MSIGRDTLEAIDELWPTFDTRSNGMNIFVLRGKSLGSRRGERLPMESFIEGIAMRERAARDAISGLGVSREARRNAAR